MVEDLITFFMCAQFDYLILDPQPKVRLYGGDTSNEGLVELKVGDTWGTVCDTT